MQADLEALETSTGYRFQNREILERALTHTSHVHERTLSGRGEGDGDVPNSAQDDNEQLEFLGDAVLGFLISESLVARFPVHREGRLSKLKAHLVSATHLFEVAWKLDLGKYLKLGRGEEMSGGRTKRTLLVDSLEALIAALYLDGGVEAARSFVKQFVIGHAEGDLEHPEDSLPDQVVDFKSALQELAQARKMPQPRYSIVKERGPEHSKTFTIEVRVGRDCVGQAEGLTKKSAAQKAAREIYERLTAAEDGAGSQAV
jgi:ribonuclease III